MEHRTGNPSRTDSQDTVCTATGPAVKLEPDSTTNSTPTDDESPDTDSFSFDELTLLKNDKRWQKGPRARFTTDEDNYILECRMKGDSPSEVAKKFNERFKLSVSSSELASHYWRIKARSKRLGYTKQNRIFSGTNKLPLVRSMGFGNTKQKDLTRAIHDFVDSGIIPRIIMRHYKELSGAGEDLNQRYVMRAFKDFMRTWKP